MKELSIEEKAKAYDEAIEKAKGVIEQNPLMEYLKKGIEYIFPELAESNDEKIRKDIIWCLKHSGIKESNPINPHVTTIIKDAIAWLEKQGEQKYAWTPMDEQRVENLLAIIEEHGYPGEVAWLNSLKDRVQSKQGEQKPTIEMITPEESLGIDSDTFNKIVDECIYGEQNPADKVEPKFKVGDFIVNDYCMGKVIELTSDAYLLDTGQGIPFSCEHNAHLWTIQDAKDGDVLVADNGSVFIYNRYLEEQQWPFAYGGINIYGRFNICDGLLPFTHQKVVPATKEHRDALIKAMTDAGYTFDFKKKELKKIEHEQSIDYPNNLPKDNWELVQEFVNKFGRIPKDEDELNALVEYVLKRQKPAWSEEDETAKNNISHIIRQYDKISKIENQPCYYVGDCLLWMQNIKNRVQPQPKQEWSEEDMKMIGTLVAIFEVNYPDGFYKVNPIGTTNMQGIHSSEIIKWLKSLRPQNWTKEDKERYISCLQRLGTGNPKQPETINSKWFKEHVYPQSQWKPSEEMLEALYRVTPENVMEKSEDEMLLDELYQGLKYGKVLSEK